MNLNQNLLDCYYKLYEEVNKVIKVIQAFDRCAEDARDICHENEH